MIHLFHNFLSPAEEAMMYAFGNRADCAAWDEPFHAFSLINKGNDHPVRGSGRSLS